MDEKLLLGFVHRPKVDSLADGAHPLAAVDCIDLWTSNRPALSITGTEVGYGCHAFLLQAASLVLSPAAAVARLIATGVHDSNVALPTGDGAARDREQRASSRG
jgi:hypothetical protein